MKINNSYIPQLVCSLIIYMSSQEQEERDNEEMSESEEQEEGVE